MADISVTSVNDVRPLPGAVCLSYVAAATLAPGQAVYVTSSGTVNLADADAEASAQARGIVACGASGATSFPAGSTVTVVVLGPITGWSSLTDGAVVYVSTTAGAMDQTAPASAGDYPFVIGWAMNDTTIFVNPQATVPVVNPG